MAAFPDEVLLDIFHYYHASEDEETGLFPQYSPTLRSLCLVSRQFRRVAEPLLYHTIFLNVTVLERWGENNNRSQPTILHALMRDPSLGRHIRTLKSTTCPLRKDRVLEQFRQQQVRRGLDECYMTDVSYWLGIVYSRDLESFDFEGWPYLVILILAIAPNLESLVLTLAEPNSSSSALFEFLAVCGRCFFENKLAIEDRGQDIILTSAFKPSSADGDGRHMAPLLKLSSLQLIGDAPGHRSDYSSALNLGVFALPQLRHFRTTNMDWEDIRAFRERWEAYDPTYPVKNEESIIKNMYTSQPDRHASMRMLYIWDSRTHNPQDLRLILQHCNQLESLVLRLDNLHSMVDYAAYGQVLAQYGQSLRRLDIYAEPTANDSWEGRDIPTIGNLRIQMPHLVHLRIFLARLIGTEGGRDTMPDPPDITSQLPEGLRWLWLTIGHPLHFKQVIQDFLETAPEHMPALEWVVIQDAHSHSIPFRSSRFHVVKLNKARKIRVFGKIVGQGGHDFAPIPPGLESAFQK